jgi:D-alanyl-D-alanine carboxypeptidase
MVEFTSATCRVLRRTTLTILGLACGLAALHTQPAAARHHRHHVFAHRGRVMIIFRVRRPALRHWAAAPAFHPRAESFGGPPFSAYAVDGNSGRVLYARDENAPRHPASITKVMTLYLLFEQIERGHLSLDSRIEVSPHAAAQAPTKLGLRPGATIRIEDAIKAIVTKSANDMAVAIAERIGGDEETFARMMTRKAHALGMSRTTFVNASGLPDDRQITTARDLAVLGRAIHDQFTRYFRFFSTPSFRYAGQYMANHNHLMEQVEGMDGIKTGYTRASGFNLLSSVNRNGHWLISVVLGGRTRLGRDHIMAGLIEAEIDKCSTRRTAPMVAELPERDRVAEAVPIIAHESDPAPPVAPADDESAEEGPAARVAAAPAPEPSGSDDAAPLAPPPASSDAPPPPISSNEPVAPKPQKLQTRIARFELDKPMPRPRPAFVSGTPKSTDEDSTTGSIARRERLDGSTAPYVGAATATPSAFRRRAQRERIEAKERDRVAPVRLASLESDAPTPTERPLAAHRGVMIQIGATPTLDQANALLGRAKAADHGLGRATAFTEKVAKGGGTLYRARFAGLDPDGAEAACHTLKRAGLACFTTRN